MSRLFSTLPSSRWIISGYKNSRPDSGFESGRTYE